MEIIIKGSPKEIAAYERALKDGKDAEFSIRIGEKDSIPSQKNRN
jgi:hypothetical protein